MQVLENQGNTAVVFLTRAGRELPSYWRGYQVLDGDVTDYRPGDCKGCVVGLRYKIAGTLSESDTYKLLKNNPFVVDPESLECQHVNGQIELELVA